MFKTLVLQASHNLSDERTEFVNRDRLSFMRFLGLGLPTRCRTRIPSGLFARR
jgi:IS5 family transposase